MQLKRAISILLSSIFIFTGIPCVYTHPQGLASRSQFELWKEKGIDPQIGLVIEAREKAIHRNILRGNRDPKALETIDAETVRRVTNDPTKFLKQYPFDYSLISFEDNTTFGMLAKIYKDKYGEQQLILFYNPDNPPWELLKKYGVRTPEDRESAKRDWWVSSSKDPVDPVRRALLALIAMAIPSAVLLAACVFDTSGLPGTKPDSGITPDGGLQPADIIERPIDTSIDTGNNPVTILQSSTFSSEDATQRLSPLSQFVRNNNAAFRYHRTSWHWTLSESDRTNILNKGFTYIFNGRNHKIKLIGQGSDGRTKTIIFNTQTPAMPDYTQPYRITINAEYIQQLAEEIGLNLSTIDVHFENLEAEEDFILNGFQKQYAVVTTSGEVTPDKISPRWEPFNFGGATISADSTLQGININFTMTAGNNGQSTGIDILTKSNGIPLNDPNLQGAWKMDGDNPGIDSGPNGNNLTNAGGVESAPGKVGNAINLSGGNYLSINSPIGLDGGTSQQTISAWVKTTALIGSIAGRWSVNGYLLGISEGGKVIYFYNLGHAIHSDIAINDNVWHHVAAVANGTEVKLYIDGVEVKSQPQEGDIGPNSIDPFIIGQNANYDWPFVGRIDEVAVFNRALTPQEIQDIAQVDSSNFLLPLFTTLDFNTRGNTPFILRLTDNTGQILDVFSFGLDQVNWRNISINIIQAQAVMNPSFNLSNVVSVKILVQDTFLPLPDGELFNGSIDINGLVGIQPITRHRYATDPHDKDLTKDDYYYLTRNLGSAQIESLGSMAGIPVIGIKKWQNESGENILSQNGLGFTVDGRVYSAFTVKDAGSPIIYIPHPELIKSSLRIKNAQILGAVDIRNNIILGHEIDEARGLDHREAVFNEFSNTSINGLNYADVVTVLLETLSSDDIVAIDKDFHRQFIANLLIQGMFLDKEGNTYIRIFKEVVDNNADEDSLRGLHKDILAEISGLVSSHRFTHRRISRDETIIPDIELQEEPGFKELFNYLREFKQSGTIYIDLAKFFVTNKSLAAEDEVVTIDFEYLKRFFAFLQKLQDRDIRVVGVYSKQKKGIPIIEQLISIIRDDLKINEKQFPIRAVDFSNYLEFISDAENTVSILTNDSWTAIPDRSSLKIVDSSMDRYNPVNSSGWEFYTALRGLEFDTPQVFLQFIINDVLQQLVRQKVITEDEANYLKGKIQEDGIAFIPTYYDPIQYYKTIESQKALLIAA